MPHSHSRETRWVSSKTEQGYRHSVCRWTYSSVPLEELCEVAIDLNIDSIELLNPSDIKKVQQRGLNCAVANSVPLSLTDGFNNPRYHAKLKQEYSQLIPVLADLGIQNLICFPEIGKCRGPAGNGAVRNRLRPYCFFGSKAWYYSRYGVIEFEGRS